MNYHRAKAITSTSSSEEEEEETFDVSLIRGHETPVPQSTEISTEVTQRFIRDGFEAYNLRPKKLDGHQFRPQIYGAEPTLEEGKMWFQSKFHGTVPVHKNKVTVVWDETNQQAIKVPERLSSDKLEGKDPRNIRVQKTNVFQVSYIVARPAGRSKNNLKNLPYVLFIPGVPMNAWLKLDLMRQIGKGAFTAAVSMLGMGDSDMPHDYGKDTYPYAEPPKSKQDRDNFNRAWDWEHDVDYMHLLMKRHFVREYNLDPKKKWVIQADDWGIYYYYYFLLIISNKRKIRSWYSNALRLSRRVFQTTGLGHLCESHFLGWIFCD